MKPIHAGPRTNTSSKTLCTLCGLKTASRATSWLSPALNASEDGKLALVHCLFRRPSSWEALSPRRFTADDRTIWKNTFAPKTAVGIGSNLCESIAQLCFKRVPVRVDSMQWAQMFATSPWPQPSVRLLCQNTTPVTSTRPCSDWS